MPKIKILLALIWALFVINICWPTPSQAWLIYHKPAFKGKVIDAETKLPIKGAVVVVSYNKTLVAGFERMTSIFDIREALTDDKGMFNIPSYTTSINPLSINASVNFMIFKPGYGGPVVPRGINSNDQELFFSEDFGKERTIRLLTASARKGVMTEWNWTKVIFGIVELPKLKTFEERGRNIPGLPDDDNFLDKQRNLFKAINEEEENLGLPKKTMEGEIVVKKITLIITAIITVISSQVTVLALEMSTHMVINAYIAQNPITASIDANNVPTVFSLDTYLKTQLGMEKGVKEPLYSNNPYENSKLIWELLRDGGKYEDYPPEDWFAYRRSRNHFHDPLVQPWTKAGYTSSLSMCEVGHCPQSAILWAQGPQFDDFYSGVNLNPGGDWSWNKVRKSYAFALTSTAQTTRDSNLADTFRGLGQVMHLVEDMSVPDHSRNHLHISDSIEDWIKTNVEPSNGIITYLPKMSSHVFGGIINGIASFFDTGQYFATHNLQGTLANAGLSEYSNANFFTTGTIFSNYSNPRKANTTVSQPENVTAEDKSIDYVNYIYFTNRAIGQTDHKLAAKSYLADSSFSSFVPDSWKYNLDDNVYHDYADKLLPRAIGYATNLLQYFFRGKIKLTANLTDISFRSVKVTAENTTPGETMGVGEVRLVIRYKELTEWPLGNNKSQLSNPPEESTSDKYAYKVSLPQYVDLTNPQQLTFDFSTDTLPYFFDDISMQLVFKGKLGNEDGAVAVSTLEPIDSVYSDFIVTLPSSGVYAKTTDNTLGATFNELKVTAQTDIPGGLTGGNFELALEYRETGGDPFQSLPVDTEPANAAAYVIRVPERTGAGILQPGTPVELAFDLSSIPLSVRSTDVYLNIIYKNSGTSKVAAVGVHDISEPTSVDIYNNTDYVCFNNQWYKSETPQILELTSNVGRPELGYSSAIKDIAFQAGPVGSTPPASDLNNNFYSTAVLAPGQSRRLGYILTDNNFSFSYGETWYNSLYPYFGDPDMETYPGHGFMNISGQSIGIMNTIRGFKLWWGTGLVYGNDYPSNSSCNWADLPLP